MARFYIAGPLFSEQDRVHLERADRALRDAGHVTFLPHRDGEDDGASRGPEDDRADDRRKRIFQADMAALARCDAVVAMLDGPDCDAGTAFELGWAYAERRPIFGFRTDFRTLGPEGAVSLMLLCACDRFVHAADDGWAAVEPELLEWAAKVRPYGGGIVRDAVPRIMKERGATIRFNQASNEARPMLLKQKVADAARRLARVDQAAEKEELADVLEAVEAFIRARGYDADSLRTVKASRWKARGGYDEGWVIAELGDGPSSTDARADEEGAGPIADGDPSDKATASPATTTEAEETAEP